MELNISQETNLEQFLAELQVSITDLQECNARLEEKIDTQSKEISALKNQVKATGSIADGNTALVKKQGEDIHRIEQDIMGIKDDLTEMRPAGDFFRDVQGGARVVKPLAFGIGALLATVATVLSIVQYFKGN